MAKRKSTSRRSTWASDAALQSLVRFGPEASGLRELLRQAQENRATTIRQAHGSAAAALGAIDTARPEVAGIYDDAGLRQAATASLLGSQTAGLSGVTDPIKAAIAAEQAQGSRHLTEMRASNLADLSNRRVQTRSGEQFAVQNAQQQFLADVAKVAARQQDMARERGAFEASTVNSLEQDYLQRALSARNSARSQAGQNARQTRSLEQQERSSLRSSGIDPDTGKPIPGGKLDPKATKPKTPKPPGATDLRTGLQHGALKDQVTSMQGWIRQNRADYGSRAEMARDLLNGVPASTMVNPKTGAKVRDPGVPKAPSALALSAALDLAFDGHISRRNVAELHKRGYVIDQLGFKGAAGTKPRRKPVLQNPWTARVNAG